MCTSLDPEEYRAALNIIFIYTSEHVTQSCKKINCSLEKKFARKNCISIIQLYLYRNFSHVSNLWIWAQNISALGLTHLVEKCC